MKRDPGVKIANFFAERKAIEQRLKPCPFCGNKDIEFSLIHPQYVGKPDMDYWVCWGIGCTECGATMEYGRTGDETWDDTQEAIIAAWNRREGR